MNSYACRSLRHLGSRVCSFGQLLSNASNVGERRLCPVSFIAVSFFLCLMTICYAGSMESSIQCIFRTLWLGLYLESGGFAWLFSILFIIFFASV